MHNFKSTIEIDTSLKLLLNRKNNSEGLCFLQQIPNEVGACAFFDPQYRGVLDKLKYGNEGKGRQAARVNLLQMNNETIKQFIKELERTLKPSGHLFLWVDKFHLCEGISHYVVQNMQVVDLITWNKERLGMGYRTRRCCEYLLVLQKKPIKAKGVWQRRDIRDCISEKIENKVHTHQKPINLQKGLIESVTQKGDIVIDPCAGSFSVMEACLQLERNFLGTDIEFGES